MRSERREILPARKGGIPRLLRSFGWWTLHWVAVLGPVGFRVRCLSTSLDRKPCDNDILCCIHLCVATRLATELCLVHAVLLFRVTILRTTHARVCGVDENDFDWSGSSICLVG